MLKLSLILFSIVYCNLIFAQIIIQPTDNANNLAQRLVGQGVIVTNAQIRNPGLASNRISSGFFKNERTLPNLSLDSGIVLTTGLAKSLGNSKGVDGTVAEFPDIAYNINYQDPDLVDILGQSNMNDATVLEFDVKSIGDTLKFRYVFASAEYVNADYVCGDFNDIFGFFISGPGFPTPKNIALIPNLNVPTAVSIKNVHPFYDNSCLASNAQYYRDNSTSLTISYYGMTTVLEAKIVVVPCETYHLKLAIADVSDGSFDSGVFLEAKSLSSNVPTITPSTPIDLFTNKPFVVEGCNDGSNSSLTVSLQATSTTNTPINFTFGGSATNGVDIQAILGSYTIPANQLSINIPIVPLIDNITEGTEYFKIYIMGSNTCALNIILDSFEIELRDLSPLTFSTSSPLGICKNTGVTITATGNYNSYSWTPTNLFNPPYNQAAATTLNINSDTKVFCLANIFNCTAFDSIQIIVKKLELLSKKDIICIGGSNGEIILKQNTGFTNPVEYSLNNIAGIYQQSNSFIGLISGTYKVYAKDPTGCIDSISVTLLNGTAPPINASVGSIISANCFDEDASVTINTVGLPSSFTYSIDGINFQNSSILDLPNSGSFIVYVKNTEGCVKTLPVLIPKDDTIAVNELRTNADCSGIPNGSLTLNAIGGSGTYNYDIIGFASQTTPSFNLNNGIYQYIVSDNKGCFATDTAEIFLTNNLTISVTSPVNICELDTFKIIATSNATSFLWTPNNVNFIGSNTILNPKVKITQSQKYYVTAKQNICEIKDSVQINMWPAPIPDAGPDQTICYGASTFLNGNGGLDYSWTPISKIISGASTNTPTIKPLTSTFYQLKVKDINKCVSINTDEVLVTVIPSIELKITQDSIVAVNQPIQLFAFDVNSSGIIKWEWQPAGLALNALVQNPIFKYTAFDNVVTLKGTTPGDCIGFGSIKIKAYKGPDIYVPNVFSPNNDGLNDLLKILPIGLKQFNFITIYNRWGKEIYRSKDYKKGWDGKINGQEQPQGTYIWMVEGIDYLGNKIFKKGSFILMY